MPRLSGQAKLRALLIRRIAQPGKPLQWNADLAGVFQVRDEHIALKGNSSGPMLSARL